MNWNRITDTARTIWVILVVALITVFVFSILGAIAVMAWAGALAEWSKISP